MKNNKKLSSIGRDVIEMIKNKNIRPQPKWKFLLKDYFIWFVGIVSIVIGSLAFSVIIYMLKNSDWDVYEHINNSLFEFIVVTLPYFWIAFLVLFVFIADYNLKHTKKGYRYQVHVVMIVSVTVSMILGLFLYNIGVGRAIDDVFAEKIPVYKQMVNKMHQRGKMWNRPNEGFLSGMIVSMDSKDRFRISDIHNTVWDIHGENAYTDEKAHLAINKGVRIFGRIIEKSDNVNSGERSFHAEKILFLPSRSWLKHEMMGRDIDPGKVRKRINKLKENDLEKIGADCKFDSDCKTPFSYMIRSSCSFESRCIDDECTVVCQMPFNSLQDDLDKVPQCSRDDDCECDEFYLSDMKKCACINETCLAVVE
jgi:hypothetical protein